METLYRNTKDKDTHQPDKVSIMLFSWSAVRSLPAANCTWYAWKDNRNEATTTQLGKLTYEWFCTYLKAPLQLIQFASNNTLIEHELYYQFETRNTKEVNIIICHLEHHYKNGNKKLRRHQGQLREKNYTRILCKMDSEWKWYILKEESYQPPTNKA
jgi:hypothetical protein